MSIRRTFLLLVAPLFLLLAGVNGALLYAWERAEAERGLANQAIAAAVTTAAFADVADDLAHALSDPVRAAGLREAARRVEGLMGLYLVTPAGRTVQIAGPPSAQGPGTFEAPQRPTAAPLGADASGQRRATGLAPIAQGGFVIAQIDAEPMFARMRDLQRLILILVAGAGLIGLALALTIARLIVRELARNSVTIAAIRADAPADDVEGFAIRETRDLALAVRLMRTSVAGRLARARHELSRRDRERDEAASAAAYRETAFPPLSVSGAAGAAVAARMLGAPPPGAFQALCVDGDRAALVLGECAGETPSAALAQALAARRFLERRLLDGSSEERLAQAGSAFGIERLAWAAWSREAPPAAQALGLLDGDDLARAQAYMAGAPGLSPEAVIDDMAALLRPDGLLAVVTPASAQAGQG
ncbi:hypothetical protein [Phenylobacterium sp. CCH12-B4]|uniref:hypothetical protein n=2 Tax=unclassified Phenylobacterium TaxID=2640670 RepID=UPI000839FAB1|nr:hypothetical protein [Phenylobacterium sp. CCH12-B4]